MAFAVPLVKKNYQLYASSKSGLKNNGRKSPTRIGNRKRSVSVPTIVTNVSDSSLTNVSKPNSYSREKRRMSAGSGSMLPRQSLRSLQQNMQSKSTGQLASPITSPRKRISRSNSGGSTENENLLSPSRAITTVTEDNEEDTSQQSILTAITEAEEEEPDAPDVDIRKLTVFTPHANRRRSETDKENEEEKEEKEEKQDEGASTKDEHSTSLGKSWKKSFFDSIMKKMKKKSTDNPA